MKSHSKYFFIGLFLFMFIIIMTIHYNKDIKLKTLLDNNSVTYARITYFGGGSGRSASPPEYTFQLNDKKIVSVFYNVRFCKKVSQGNQFNFSKNQFPVIYNPTNPEINQILLKIEDYNKFNVPIPDTLAEVLVEYFNCDQYRVIRQSGKQTRIVKIK